MDNMTGDSSSNNGDLSNHHQDPLPWLELEATVMDEMDFSTGMSVSECERVFA